MRGVDEEARRHGVPLARLIGRAVHLHEVARALDMAPPPARRVSNAAHAGTSGIGTARIWFASLVWLLFEWIQE